MLTVNKIHISKAIVCWWTLKSQWITAEIYKYINIFCMYATHLQNMCETLYYTSSQLTHNHNQKIHRLVVRAYTFLLNTFCRLCWCWWMIEVKCICSVLLGLKFATFLFNVIVVDGAFSFFLFANKSLFLDFQNQESGKAFKKRHTPTNATHTRIDGHTEENSAKNGF